MTPGYFKICSAHKWAILTLGMAYGATIVFTFFGPVMTRAAGPYAPALSLLAVGFHILAFYLSPFAWESESRVVRGMALLLVPGVLGFSWLPVYGQVGVTIFFAWTVGRIGCFWTYAALKRIPEGIRGHVIAASLFVSFTVLYLVHVTLPALPVEAGLAIAVVTAILAILGYNRMKGLPARTDTQKMRPPEKEAPYFTFLLLVYVSGGFTYAGIYPYFQPYAHVDRYFNVLFFMVAAVIAGRVLDTRGRKSAFGIGVAFLGISFGAFLMPQSLVAYLLTQTFLQAGWAFVNCFGWSFSWDMAGRSGQDYHFSRGISAMLLGASLGAFLSHMMAEWGQANKLLYGVVSFIPLFLTMAWLMFFPETLNQGDPDKAIRIEDLESLPALSALTQREMEVCCHMVNGLTNAGIGEKLFISESTVKTHAANIYVKLSIGSGRKELRETITGLLKIL